MSILRQSAASTEFVRVLVETTGDPTSGLVDFAFVANEADIDDADWYEGEWDTVADAYYAQVLVGPEAGGSGGEGVELERGTWLVFVQWTIDEESPARVAGTLEVF